MKSLRDPQLQANVSGPTISRLGAYVSALNGPVSLAVFAVQSISKKLLTSAILALYGGISVLGYGLHALAPHGGQHRGTHIVECATHRVEDSCGCAFHRRAAERAATDEATANSTAAIVQSGDCVGCSRECGICAFLAQARSVPPQLVATAFWQPLVTDIQPASDSLHHDPVSLGPHAPRGPPRVA